MFALVCLVLVTVVYYCQIGKKGSNKLIVVIEFVQTSRSGRILIKLNKAKIIKFEKIKSYKVFKSNFDNKENYGLLAGCGSVTV